MNRYHIIQKIIDSINAQTYLEIGIRSGGIINKIKAPNKIGVDPAINFSKKMRIKKKLGLLDFDIYGIESDKFFKNNAPGIYGDQGVDVVFVDGLHEYKQALRDVKNALEFLTDKGVIIMHDCNPLNFAGAYPIKESFDELKDLITGGKIPGWNDCWNGDVWKALVQLRTEHSDLNIFTLDIDWGLGIITKGNGNKIDNISIHELEESDYSLLEADRENLLNLKPPSYLADFIEKQG